MDMAYSKYFEFAASEVSQPRQGMKLTEFRDVVLLTSNDRLGQTTAADLSMLIPLQLIDQGVTKRLAIVNPRV